MNLVKVKVLFVVTFATGKWEVVEETVVVRRGTPEKLVIMEASAWLDRRLEQGFLAGKNADVVHLGPIFPVYNIYECGEAF